jgi:beta-phosphoglucomutase family hydrolase
MLRNLCLVGGNAIDFRARRTSSNGAERRRMAVGLVYVNWNDFDAALFDLDGVLTPTAEVHMRAWQALFTDLLTKRGFVDQPYVENDYFAYIDGKPRYDGVRSFLASRGITLPDGDPSDDPATETVCGLGNRKNLFFNAVLSDEGVLPYPGSVQLLDFLAERDTKVAVVSSSKNARPVLEAAGIAERFEVVVDGNVGAQEHLPGKPAPDTFAYAATQLGVPKDRAVVFEDALSGVEAGRAGRFGLVVGVDRGVGTERLIESGADIVVTDLAELAE